MAFWDSMLGNQLAKTLIRELPKLNAEAKQYSETMPDDRVQDFIKVKIEAGERYVNHFSFGGKTTVIMEKK